MIRYCVVIGSRDDAQTCDLNKILKILGGGLVRLLNGGDVFFHRFGKRFSETDVVAFSGRLIEKVSNVTVALMSLPISFSSGQIQFHTFATATEKVF